MNNENRVITTGRGVYGVETRDGVVLAALAGKFIHEADTGEKLPAVGDYVLLDSEGRITGLQPRKSVLRRQVAGVKSDSQLIAANVDYAIICMSLNENLSLRRLERYLTAFSGDGAEPVLVLTKSDLCTDPEEKRAEFEGHCKCRVLLCSVVKGYGELEALLCPDSVSVLIGSSGVGKSTLLNALLGTQKQETREIGYMARGRHTTTSRELFHLPNGACIIDTPGMRELKLAEGDPDTVFDDITELAKDCRFSNCCHKNEPDCAVRAALREGRLDEGRYNSYLKLKRELEAKKSRLPKREPKRH